MDAHQRGQDRRIQTAYRAVVLAGALVVLGLVFREILTLLLAVLMTVIIAIPLSAGAARLERHKIPRPLGALATLLAGLTVLGVVLALIIPAFVDQGEQFADDVPGILDRLEDRIRDATGAEPGEVTDEVESFVERYTDDPSRIVSRATAIGLGIVGVLAALLVMLVTAYFMAARPQPLIRGALRLFPPDRRDRALAVMERLRRAWVGWLLGVTCQGLLTGSLVYLGLLLVGLDFAIVFAVLSALLVVVPYYGAFVGGLIPTLFALTDSPGKALLVLGVYLIVQQIESNVLVPMVMSRAVRLHPAVIAIGVVVVGQLFGVAGLFVAVPLLSLLVILVEELWVIPMEEAEASRLGMPPPHGLPEHELDESELAASRPLRGA